MVKHCIAYGCVNRSSKPECKGLSWHSLPLNNKPLLSQWIVKLRRENTPCTKNSFVCSEHFEEDCFTKSLGGQKRYLKPDSVPTKFVFTIKKPKRRKLSYSVSPPVTPIISSSSKTVLQETPTHNNKENIEVNDYTDITTENDVQSTQTENTNADFQQCYENSFELPSDECLDCVGYSKKQIELQDRIKELEKQLEEERSARKELELLIKKKDFSIESVKDNDKLIRFYTGFENYEMFTTALDFLGREAASTLDYQNTEDVKDLKSKYKRGPNRALTIENEFFMVLCRLKVGLLEEDLTTRFGVCQSVVSQIITTWIKFMYFRYKELDIFPSKEIVKVHMPECFLKKYSSTTLIIDATEIYIEKPCNPEAQQLTFSSYKNTNTLKALVGITPKGAISFVSTLYGGSISDKEITQMSGLIDKLERGDVIMADRGFNIQEMLASKGVRVNLPPFMNQSGQFTENELLVTRRIASLRIHVERAMERIKNYHILDFIPITLCRNGIIDMIFFVCAMLSNYLPPLVDG